MPRALAVVALAIATLAGGAAHAIDQPLSGAKLVLKRGRAGAVRLLFLSQDSAAMAPVPGGPDDPISGVPGGASIDVVSGSEGAAAALAVPGGAAQPGWTVDLDSARFRNPLAPNGPSFVRTVVMKQGMRLKLVARHVPLPLAEAHGTLTVRITTGTLRQCARADAGAIVVDEPGKFVAVSLDGAALADCSDASIGAPTCTDGSFVSTLCGGTCSAGSACGTQDLQTCICISASQPCGDTWPVCNGICSLGEECGATGGFPLPGCGCVPSGSTPCGLQCGGSCPTGGECNYYERSTPGASGCVCGPPGPCGSGGDDCPPGFHCGVADGYAFCVPG